MFKSKKDVDSHVRDIFQKCKSENERLKLCFGIARQYTSIREFESARRYLETHLNSKPANSADAHKLMGDILQELGDLEKALESYKTAYIEGKGREALNRVCDLLHRGIGIKETAESKQKWFDTQKSTMNNNPMSSASSTGSSPVVPRRTQSLIGGPPKTGFSSSFTNGSPSPLVSSASKTNGNNNVDLQLRYLERRFDDGLGKILDQNNILLEQMLKIKDDMKELSDNVQHVSASQEQVQSEMKELADKLEHVVVSQEQIRAEMKETTGRVQNLAVNQGLMQAEIKELKEKQKQSNSMACQTCTVGHTPRTGYEKMLNDTSVNSGTSQTNFTTRFPLASPTAASFSIGFGNTTATATTGSAPISEPVPVQPQPPSAPLVESKPIYKVEDNAEPAFPGLNLSGKFSFADLAKNPAPMFSFGNPGKTAPFSGVGAPLFSSTDAVNKSTSDGNTSHNADDAEDDFVPTAEFQPVIPLPPLVEVKKGDENENAICEYRAKLYRFVSETKEWKERGVGNIKLLQSKTDSKKCRVVMWREKVGKLACNFSLYPDIKVENYQNNPKVLCWKCQDFTEDSAWETFTLRFGNEDNCTHFKTEMMRLAALTTVGENSPSGLGATKSTGANNVTTPTSGGTKDVPLSQLFKKPEGSWNCDACYCSNEKDVTACAACQTPRPGYENIQKEASVNSGTVQPSFSFGFPATNSNTTPAFSFGFTNMTTAATTGSGPISEPVPVHPPPAPLVESKPINKVEDNAEPAFPGLNLSGKFSFADLAKNNNPTPTFMFENPGKPTGFSGAGAPLFSSAAVGKKTTSDGNTSHNADDAEDDFVPTAEFQPVIPLPPLVEVKKGDENENTICEYRAKLYRFVSETKEWKERGVGNIKLLQSKTDAKKCRVVMWREKVGKLACNFSLYPDIKVENYQNNPKVLCWKCQDFTEDSAWETFTLRFGNEDNCTHFKTEMMRLAALTTVGENSPSGFGATKSTGANNVTTPTSGGTKDVPLSQLFKKPEGSWNCDACYCSNEKDVTACAACQTPRPGYENVPLSQLFKKPEGSWNCDACYCSNEKDVTTCAACQTPRPGYENIQKEASVNSGTVQPSFSFGFPATNSNTTPAFSFGFTNTTAAAITGSAPVTEPAQPPPPPASLVESKPINKVEDNAEPAFPGLNLSGKFSFADLAKNNNPTTTFSFTNPGNSQSFAGAGAPLFSTMSTSNKSTDGNTSHNADDAEDDFVPTAEFQPVIPLPPLVEVKKGDENENTICEYRAKLYRFVSETKEWKERGIGNIKLLQSKTDAKKCRVVMWREKIGKLACNFSLYPDIKVEYYQNNLKVLCWKCQDFAEEPAWQTFTLRFSSEENCRNFKSEMESLAKLTTIGDASPFSTPQGKSPISVSSHPTPLSQLFKKPEGNWTCNSCYCSNSKDAVVCISCQASQSNTEQDNTTTETEDNAKTCSGCIGCNPDSLKFSDLKKPEGEDTIDIPLAVDSSNELPSVVRLSSFITTFSSSVNDSESVVNDSTNNDSKGVNNSNSSMSNFQFSFQTPDKANPISFQFKTPSFSFKSPDANTSVFGGSIFTPPVGGNPPGSTPSPFVSPFSQQSSLLNNSSSPQPVSFAFSQPLFNQQSLVQTTMNDEAVGHREGREEDEYEDVDDEEEDECMFEDDAHVYIRDDADSSEEFSDKGEAVVRVLYDGESYCARLVILAEGETIVEHLVASETHLEHGENFTYEWTGVCNFDDSNPIKSKIKAVFSTEDAFKSFATVMADSLEFAEQAGITEEILLGDASGGY